MVIIMRFVNISIENEAWLNDLKDDFLSVGKAEGDFNKEIEAIKAAVTALVTESSKYAILPLKDLNMRAVALTKYIERSQKAV